MARKGWNALSPGYRARLEKAGITKRDYEGGHSLQSARGHSTTPERPSAASASKHGRYVSERNRLIAKVVGHKHDYFSGKPKWNPTKSAKAFKDNPPPLARLKYWAALTKDEWLDAIREDPNAIEFLGYH